MPVFANGAFTLNLSSRPSRRAASRRDNIDSDLSSALDCILPDHHNSDLCVRESAVEEDPQWGSRGRVLIVFDLLRVIDSHIKDVLPC